MSEIKKWNASLQTNVWKNSDRLWCREKKAGIRLKNICGIYGSYKTLGEIRTMWYVVQVIRGVEEDCNNFEARCHLWECFLYLLFALIFTEISHII